MLTRLNESLWGDEGFSAILSMRPPAEIISTIIRDTSPPLWNLFEWLVFNTLGTAEVYIRALSFVFFLGALFFTYKIGAFLFNKRTGLIALFLTFFNPFFFTYAFEGRMYSIMALGVAASMFYFLKRKWLPYIFWTLWALYSHHFAIFAIFVQGLWFLYEFVFKSKKEAGKMFKAFLGVGIGYLPWLYPLYLQTTKVSGGFWLGVPSRQDLRNLFYDYLGEGTKHTFGELARNLALVSLIIRKWNKNFEKSLFLFTWFFFPIFATWAVSQVFQPIFFNRYLLYTIPAAMLLVASNERKFSKFVIGLLLALYATISFHYFTHPTKIPFKVLASYVKETKSENDFLINEDPGNHKLWEAKYYGIPAPILVEDKEALPFFVGTALMEETDLVTEIPQNTDKLGVITYKEGKDLVFENFELLEEKRFGELNFVWLKKN